MCGHPKYYADNLAWVRAELMQVSRLAVSLPVVRDTRC